MLLDTTRLTRLSELIPGDVHTVMQTLAATGHSVWIVGGAIRDILLGLTPKDWDLSTDASTEQVMHLFPHVVPIGFRHGTVQVRTAERGIEITSFDREGGGAILSDLARRDFTLNAIAFSLGDEELLDPYSGLPDLDARILRGVVDAAARFREDPLRTLRGGRMVSELGFSMEPETFRALAREAHRLGSVAPERIRDEMFKLLPGEHVSDALVLMREGGVLHEILPELDPAPTFQHTMRVVQQCTSRLRLRLAALLHSIGWDENTRSESIPTQSACAHAARESARKAEQILMRWRASRRETEVVKGLVGHQLPPEARFWPDGRLRRWMAASGVNRLEDLFELARSEWLAGPGSASSPPERESPDLTELDLLKDRIVSLLRQNPPLTIRQLALNGEEVMRVLQLAPGPDVGRILRHLHARVLEDPQLNTPASLTRILKAEFHPCQQEYLE